MLMIRPAAFDDNAKLALCSYLSHQIFAADDVYLIQLVKFNENFIVDFNLDVKHFKFDRRFNLLALLQGSVCDGLGFASDNHSDRNIDRRTRCRIDDLF